MAQCALCGSAAVAMPTDYGMVTAVACKKCGRYEGNLEELTDLKREKPYCIPRLIHRMCRMRTAKEDKIILRPELVESLIADPLPSVREQEDNLLLWMGDKMRAENPTGFINMGENADFVSSWVGAFSTDSLYTLVEYLKQDGFLTWTNDGSKNPTRMTPKGWDRYENIRLAPSQARLAFMAMPFGNPELDRVYTECFKPAVKKNGFELRRVDEHQRAGLIDDQLRVSIRSSRFLIAELTTENRGAYWEAGFAEGLGRDVIYTCKKGADVGLSTHFDTNHHLTVQWEPDKLNDAAEKLKAVIRATLPTEAIQRDD
jgi:hypothetical protein